MTDKKAVIGAEVVKRKCFSFMGEEIPPFVTKKKKWEGEKDPNSAAFPPFSTPINEEGPPTPRKGGKKSENTPKAEGKKTQKSVFAVLISGHC